MGNLSVSKRWTCILLLAALCAIPAAAQGVTATPVAAVSPQTVATAAPAPVSAETAEFLASLAPAPATGLTPSPEFLQTGAVCPSPCPAGTLCCRDCGYFGCTQVACLTPIDGHCPAIP
jgi:hypothetical protein